MDKSLKPIRKLLRKWAATAHERELEEELKKLHAQFNEWASSKMTSFEISDAIHQFHEGPARRLYGRYSTSHLEENWLIASAVARGIIMREELPAELFECIEPQLNFVETEN
ncbi:MAG: hypothetical protein K2X93_21175 [Candidatus Obscuribacterales bacterium]|nr:hypothetical protein [Candidatus Obscuribacterales bacterium]